MPKHAIYLLIWSFQTEMYEIRNRGEAPPLHIPPGSQEWFVWLDEVSSFSFHSRSGHTCTVRKERVQRGDSYWYGYRQKSGKTVKRYLGRSGDLNINRLE